MKKQNLINLVRYHTQKNDYAFTMEVAKIARELDANGDSEIAQYLMEMVSNVPFLVPQATYQNLRFLRKVECSTQPLILPDAIEEDVRGIAKAINKKSDLTKFLFHGAPGTGKTESACQIARLLNRDILSVSFEQLVDSHLGETAKNVSMLFNEISRLPYGKCLVLFDEIDALVLDRVNGNDHREMGRVTSTFLKELDDLKGGVPIIATTNLIKNFDKALLRRFDAVISFDRYSREDLIAIAEAILTNYLKNATNSRKDIRLFDKILNNLAKIPLPGDMKQIIKTAIGFADEENEYDYLRRINLSLNEGQDSTDIQKLKEQGYTTREIEILTKVPKSSVSRKLKGAINEQPA